MKYVRESIRGDVSFIAPLLRPADKRELEAWGHYDHEECLLHGLENSNRCITLLTPDGVPCGMAGVITHVITGAGYVWLLATEEIEKYPVTFLKNSHTVIDELCRGYPFVTCLSDSRNELHQKWLKWCGFELKYPYLYKATETSFNYYEKGGTADV